MLHSLNIPANGATGPSVLERRRARMKWQEELLQQQSFFEENELNVFSMQAPQQFEGMINNEPGIGEIMTTPPIKPDPGWPDFGAIGGDGLSYGSGGLGSEIETNYAISRTVSCPPAVARDLADSQSIGRESVLPEKLSSMVGRESFKKRKADKTQNLKAILEDDNKEKRMKGCSEEDDSKITEQNSNNNNNGGTSVENSKENSKVSEVKKSDYIHVRARRGQATDSHSLAERVRREKISERMKYLQDLVPGCNKITGKAGMLDEIINYVQSLQRQVEFLSMKLAVINPRLDFNIDNFFAKEQMFPASTSNIPAIGVSPEMANPAYLQYNQLQQVVSCCELEMGINPPDMALRRTISAPMSIPETFVDSSCFNQIQSFSTWDAEFQNLYGIELQGRSTPFPLHPFTGSVEAGDLKMEM